MSKNNIKIIYGIILGLVVWAGFSTGQARAFTLGEQRDFFVDSVYDVSSRAQVKATLRQVGDKALFYAADDWWSGLGSVQASDAAVAIVNLSVEFDKTIYPRLIRVFGSEWSPGIDGELRIVILITSMNKGTGGYFNSIDEYPRTQFASSNEREIIYLNSLYVSLISAKVFLAHEFQHMINFYQKEKLRNSVEDIWLNEARSEYAATLAGYDNIYAGSNLERRVRDFSRNPGDSLTEWQNEPADYGAVNLFMQYLISRYGEQILIKMMQSEAVGITSINQALAAAGFDDRFSDVFTNWTIANYVNDCQLGQGQKYCYLNQNLTHNRLRVNPQISNFLAVREGADFAFTDAVKDWSARWHEILPVGSGLNLLVDFRAAAGSNFQTALVIFNQDGTKGLRLLKLDQVRSAADIIANFGSQVAAVVLVISNQAKQANFSANEAVSQFSYSAKIIATLQLPPVSLLPSPAMPTITPMPTPAPIITNPGLADGSLVRVKGEIKVYIIKGKYKRWLQAPPILAAYPHLLDQNIIEVTAEQAGYYKDAWLIRAEGDYRVYEINGDLSKHWLNMSAAQFALSGRLWDMVYIVNAQERELYKTGAEVLK